MTPLRYHALIALPPAPHSWLDIWAAVVATGEHSRPICIRYDDEYAAMIAVSAMMVVLFLGGWTLPFAGLNETASTLGIGLLQVGIFIGKLLLFMGLFIWVRWMLPRFRYDQLMDLGWKRFVPLALANIVVTALYLYFTLTK